MNAHLALLKTASGMMKGLLDEVDRLQADLTVAKAANLNKIELEKVASPKTVSMEKAAEFAAYLASREIIKDSEREKYAAACLENPDNIVDIAKHALKLSEPPASQGYGIKTANAGFSEAELSLQEERKLWNIR